MTDKELMNTVTEFTKGILSGNPSKGMCFIVCSPLSAFLSLGGIETRLIHTDLVLKNGEQWEHCYLVTKDDKVIDPTIDQFFPGKEMGIFIGPLDEWVNLMIEVMDWPATLKEYSMNTSSPCMNHSPHSRASGSKV